MRCELSGSGCGPCRAQREFTWLGLECLPLQKNLCDFDSFFVRFQESRAIGAVAQVSVESRAPSWIQTAGQVFTKQGYGSPTGVASFFWMRACSIDHCTVLLSHAAL